MPIKVNAQTQLRGFTAPSTYNELDFKDMAYSWKANVIRWRIEPGRNADPATATNLILYDKWLQSKLNFIDTVLKTSLKYKIKVILVLFYPPGNRYKGNNNQVMFYEKKYNDHFIKVWQIIASLYKNNPAVWGYDLVNEPIQTLPKVSGLDYYTTESKAAAAIYKIDSKVNIIFETDKWDRADSYAQITPINLPHMVYEVHMYDPYDFTHQGIYNNDSDIIYPGVIKNKMYNKQSLTDMLQPLRNFQLKYNVRVYIGEFSAARWAPGAAQYLNDCINIFEGYGWDWTYHAFRESGIWSLEDENAPTGDKKKTVKTNTDRKSVIISYLKKNSI